MSASLKDKKEVKTFFSKDSFYTDYIKEKVDNKEIEYIEEEIPPRPWYIELLPSIILLGLIIGAWYIFMTQTQGGNSKVMSFGKSRAKLHKDDGEQITFDDVAGLVEEKEELGEIVDFLKNPKKFTELGARIPKGVLMVGPPGTGKTYLSKAVAGEAKVPFYSISGSDFVEMFVGVGASRVRDLFQEAKKNSPCIIFIDEIDAVGRRRGAGLGGGHDEREQTLNQLLVEMDGFKTNEGIIVMAATNRPDILDPAILRPGRFDRTVNVGLPDVKGREAILKIHTRNKRLEADVDLGAIAKTTAGFTPADLENLCNEAALLTARKNLKAITREIIEEASIKVVAGPEKKSKVVIEKERVLTAYHEAGHAIVSRLLPDTDPVHMITIIPRGGAGGFTAYIPKEELNYSTKKGMKHRLITLLGGRAAESVALDDISTGASNDIERATELARAMVTIYGMSSRLGPIKYGTDENDVFLGRDIGRSRNYSEEVASEIDEEIRKLIGDAYSTATSLLNENIDVLHSLAKVLLEKETINSDEFDAIFQNNKNNSEVDESKIHEKVKEVREMEKAIDETIETAAGDYDEKSNDASNISSDESSEK
ncbi:ATP-dependent zinc metalloprotease FtsH [Citroniella saccharovorans]|uniref:ATP-dependent zinc metalloprotease FtsH n=1 Tax=Citroniella saccharovorans TaxID=2053367 RepID=A0AAW9MVT2_9FIRM|nr:ATP-dependent zinc metalloprotease FtsH [Citroniella saccharovorans]MEB3429058.1 ATP-dependent zinc metalloprotease FtsH [Citroniella saccharovorans]